MIPCPCQPHIYIYIYWGGVLFFSAEPAHFLPFTIRGFSMYFWAIQRAWLSFARTDTWMCCVAVRHVCWLFPKWGTPIAGWFVRENPIKMDDLRVPYFRNPPCQLVRWASFSRTPEDSGMLLHFDLCHLMTLTMPTVYATNYDKLTSCWLCSLFDIRHNCSHQNISNVGIRKHVKPS